MAIITPADAATEFPNVATAALAFKANGGTLRVLAKVADGVFVDVPGATATEDTFRLVDAAGATLRFVTTGAAQLTVYGV